MAARLAAVLVAIAMVAVAFVARDRLENGDSDDGGRSGPLVLACSYEVACGDLVDLDGVELRVGPAGLLADDLASTGSGSAVDGWLTVAPFPAIVNGLRERAGAAPTFDRTEVLGRSPLVIAVWPDRATVLASYCGGPFASWRCLGEAAAEPSWAAIGGEETWGPVKIGLADPATMGVGLLTLGHATLGWFGRDDIGRFDLETDDRYRRWLTGLDTAIRSRSGGELEHMLLAPGALDAAASLEAEAATLLDRLAAGRPRPNVIYPAPMATADAVLATTAGERGQRLADAVRARAIDALAAAGWRVDDRRGPAPGEPALPAANGLPTADVLEAIREVWVETAR